MENILNNWEIILAALLPLAKVIVNLTPSKKDNQIFGWIDKLIDAFIPNFDKDLKTHNTNIVVKKKEK